MSAIILSGLSNAVFASALAVLVLLMTIRSKRPAWTHVMWVLVLLKLLLPPLFWLPIEYSTTANATVVVSELQHSKDVKPLGRSFVGAEGPVVDSLPPVIVEPPENDIPASTLASQTVRVAAKSTATSPGWKFPGTDWITILLVVWSAGAVVVLARTAKQLRRFRRIIRSSLPVPTHVSRLLSEVNEEVGLNRLPAVIVVSDTSTPMVFAIGRRATLVVSEKLLTQLDDRELSTLLAHELAHLRRGDHWVRLLELATSIVFWWHPVVRLARRQIHRAEETVCDAWVTSLMPDRADAYASAMLKTVEMISGGKTQHLAFGSAMGDMEELMHRMRSIGSGTTPHSVGRRGWLVIACLAVLSVPTGFFANATADEKSPPSKSASFVSAEPPQDQPNRTKPTEAQLLGFVNMTDGQAVMWKPDGTATDTLPVSADLVDGDSVAVIKTDTAGHLINLDGVHGTIWRSPKDNSIVFLWLPRPWPDRKFINVSFLVDTPVRQQGFFSLTPDDVGKTVPVNKYGIAKFTGLASVDGNSSRVSVNTDSTFYPMHRLVAVSKDGKMHVGKLDEPRYESHGKVEVTTITYPVPISELTGIAIAELETERVFFSNAARHPGAPGSGRRVLIANADAFSRKLPPREPPTQRFSISDNLTVDIVAVGRLADRGLQWWSPDGTTEVRLDNVHEADIEGCGTVVAYRSSGEVSFPFGGSGNPHYSHSAQLWLSTLVPIRTGFGEPWAGELRLEGPGNLSLQVASTAYAETIERHAVDPSDNSINVTNSKFITAPNAKFIESAPGVSSIRFLIDRDTNVGFAVTNREGEIFNCTGGGGGISGSDVYSKGPVSVSSRVDFPQQPQDIRELLVVRGSLLRVDITNISLELGNKTKVTSTVLRRLHPKQ